MPALQPHEFWQRIEAADSVAPAPPAGWRDAFPARLADGRVLRLPIRVLPGGGDRAVASLIVNQASFAVVDTLTAAMAGLAAAFAPEVVVGVPTLGLPLAEGVARRLGHPRMVALGTSRKFWYDEALSEPMASITSPGAGKRIYLDPRMRPVLAGRRVLLVDDVVSTGTSLAAVLRLLAGAGIEPVAVAVAMIQTTSWRQALAGLYPDADRRLLGVLASPLLAATAEGGWLPAEA